MNKLRLLFALSAMFPSLGRRLSAQACDPNAQTAVPAHFARVREALDSAPQDPVHWFRLAVDQAALCQDDAAFESLGRLVTLPGGLDPGVYRAFARLRSDRRFAELIARIHRANPPLIHSSIAFIMGRPGVYPEGMAYDAVNRRVYLGSTLNRNIIWTDSTGVVHDLVSSGSDGLGDVLGLHLDARRRQLWAVSTGGGGPQSARIARGLFKYDLDSGRLLARYGIPDTSGDVTFNDVVVDPETGIAYTTRTLTGSVYAAAPGDSALREVVPPGVVPQANGITLSPDGAALIVAGGLGLVRIDLRTMRPTPLARAPGVVDVTVDGIYRYGRSLIGIQNGVHPGRVVRFELDPTSTRLTRMRVLEAYNPLFDGPTTGSVSGDAFYFIANPQNRRRIGVPNPPDPATLGPVYILRLSLRP